MIEKKIREKQIKPQEMEMLISENEEVKIIVEKQHRKICEMQKKEEKVMNLLFILYKKGIDLAQNLS